MFLCNNLKVLIKMYLLRFESSIKYKILKYFESEFYIKGFHFLRMGLLNYLFLINRANSIFCFNLNISYFSNLD